MTGPDPAVAAARSAVAAATADLPVGALVLVACSGGTDSLALAAAAAFVARVGRGEDAPRLRAGAVVIDHGLQPGSAQVADEAARACRELGLDPVRVVTVAVGTVGGPEAAARGARYAALEQAAADEEAAAVLVGHTLDDQAETVLLGLARGSGARSLAGMPAVQGIVRRPLLGLTRAQTAAACEAQGLEPWHDPTNAGSAGDPLRSRLRAEVMPVLARVLGPGVPAALARTAHQLAEDAEALEALAAALLTRASGGAPDAGLDVATLAAAPAAVRRRALRVAAIEQGSPPGSLHRVHVLALDALVVDWHGQGPVALPGGATGGLAGTRACGRLVIGPQRPVAPVQPADVQGRGRAAQSRSASSSRHDDEE